MSQSNHTGVGVEPGQSIPAFEKLLVAADFSKSSSAVQSQSDLLAEALKGSDSKGSVHRVYGEPLAVFAGASRPKQT